MAGEVRREDSLLDPESECEALLPMAEVPPREQQAFLPSMVRQAYTAPMLLALCITGVALTWLKGTAHPRFLRFGVLSGDVTPPQPQVKEEAGTTVQGLTHGCGSVDDDMDYWTQRPLKNEHVTSAGLCRARCTWEVRCGAWTWGKQRGVKGLSDVCFLKILDKGHRLHKKRRDGVVSGLPCRVSWGDTPDVPTHSPEVAPTTLRATSTTVVGDASSVFCFALMLPKSYEQTLLAMQYRQRVSMFACDEYAVYSNAEIQITPGLNTLFVNNSLHCERGGEFGTALNTGIFVAVWKVVANDAQYLRHDWTVKVDPDAVFFPGRLKIVLQSHRDTAQGVYLNNCKYGLHGPLEVFSRNAVTLWVAGVLRCQDHFNQLCKGPCLWGEDMFIDQCLSKVLGVKREDEFELLIEDHCDPPQGWETCTDATHVAFHPFKTLSGYQECLHNAKA